ncbi:hypothetical protein Pfo_027842 [Paulownia fortunei]|nr:hypothetical protein Pfo_027842 [Paulownia fortunei]
MADKEQQSPHPLVPANGYARSDAEAATPAADDRELRKKKRKKCLLYIVLFAVFQSVIILVFALTVMKIRTPKFRVRSAALDNFTTPANSSLNVRMRAELGVKNTNFGRFKYQSSTVYFYYRGAQVGEVLVRNWRANWRSTRKMDVVADLSLGNGGANSELESDLRSGVVPITSQGKLRGKVELMFVMKKNRSADMNCSMEIVTATQQVQNIVCK